MSPPLTFAGLSIVRRSFSLHSALPETATFHTYVTFMVAMVPHGRQGMAQGECGLSYNGFHCHRRLVFTAITAFTMAFLIALVINWGELLHQVRIAIALVILVRSGLRHGRR